VHTDDDDNTVIYLLQIWNNYNTTHL